jgi:beta-mannosidase
MKKWLMPNMTESGSKGAILFFFVMMGLMTIGQDILSWDIKHAKSGEMIPLGTHGSVQEALISKGELPDPFVGKNEELFKWIEDHTWEFYSTFNVTEDMLQQTFLELEFPYIDTYAEIYLNDSLLAFTQNAFRPFRFQIRERVKQGDNDLRIKFYPPTLYHRESYQKASYHLPAPNDVHEIAIAPYTRKPQYQFGWDWALRMNTIGVLKPVKLHSYKHARIVSTNVTVLKADEKTADLTLNIAFDQPSVGKLVWRSKLFGEVIFDEATHSLSREVALDQPVLWWPKGQGEAYLYEDEWIIETENGVLVDQKKVRFGVRTSQLIQESDKWGTSYEIHINGRPVFCKGADYIPQDVFPSRVKDEDLRKMVEMMAAANFNMVRVWGGGYYPDEAFFDACDELGIMVWQDFMFACAMYPGDPEFLQNVKEEVDFQIPRIASHASVVIFNGNNEVDVAWKNWGFQVRYNLYGKDAREIEDSYDRLFKQLLPSRVSFFSNTPYIHTSPLSNWGKDEFYDHGSQHYWGVWHGKDPMSDFGKKVGRFNAEYGFQSFPEYSTLLSFSSRADWDVQSEIMKHHQKSYVGNLMILKHAKVLFGMPDDFERFVYYSQLTQSTAVRMAVTGHRLDRPRCMGTLYWQLNDCWPAPTWSSIDHFWNWKALHYWIKDDYKDVTVLGKWDENGVPSFYLSSDVVDTFMCQLFFKVYDLEGKLLFENNCSQLVRGVENEKICMNSFDTMLQKNAVIEFNWKDQKGMEHSRTFSHLPMVYSMASEKEVKLEVISNDTEKKELQVRVITKKYLRNFWIYSNKTGIQFDRNFIDLIPGEHIFKLKYVDSTPVLEDLGTKWM